MAARAFAALLGLAVLRISSPFFSASALSTSYYDNSCPQLDHLVSDSVEKAMKNDNTVPAALLRMHFHDCFIRVMFIRRPCISFHHTSLIFSFLSPVRIYRLRDHHLMWKTKITLRVATGRCSWTPRGRTKRRRMGRPTSRSTRFTSSTTPRKPSKPHARELSPAPTS